MDNAFCEWNKRLMSALGIDSYSYYCGQRSKVKGQRSKVKGQRSEVLWFSLLPLHFSRLAYDDCSGPNADCIKIVLLTAKRVKR